MKVTKEQAITIAKVLASADNPEYVRGMVELIAYLFPSGNDPVVDVESVTNEIMS